MRTASGRIGRAWMRNSAPDIPGIIMSLTTTTNGLSSSTDVLMRSSASDPELAVLITYRPRSVRRSPSSSRGSSSTSKIRPLMVTHRTRTITMSSLRSPEIGLFG